MDATKVGTWHAVLVVLVGLLVAPAAAQELQLPDADLGRLPFLTVLGFP